MNLLVEILIEDPHSGRELLWFSLSIEIAVLADSKWSSDWWIPRSFWAYWPVSDAEEVLAEDWISLQRPHWSVVAPKHRDYHLRLDLGFLGAANDFAFLSSHLNKGYFTKLWFRDLTENNLLADFPFSVNFYFLVAFVWFQTNKGRRTETALYSSRLDIWLTMYLAGMVGSYSRVQGVKALSTFPGLSGSWIPALKHNSVCRNYSVTQWIVQLKITWLYDR